MILVLAALERNTNSVMASCRRIRSLCHQCCAKTSVGGLSGDIERIRLLPDIALWY
jgi:hypothetical protein